MIKLSTCVSSQKNKTKDLWFSCSFNGGQNATACNMACHFHYP